MSVVCPGCGREYDVTLFSHGRTIHCTCGARVAAAGHRRVVAGERFLADAMLGSLARWMRLAGLDAAYEADVDDEDVVRRSLAEHRVILTRDRRLPQEWTAPPVHVVRAEETLAQLVEVVGRFDLAEGMRPLSRCSVCNGVLVAASPGAVRDGVPPGVRAEVADFRICPSCRRIYWRGSHTERIEATLERVRAVVREGHRRYRRHAGRTPSGGGAPTDDGTRHDTGEEPL